MSRNANLKEARQAKNDEFYTQLSDIERELGNYQKHFYGKVIYLNCDNPEESNFWTYFNLNFHHLGLKKLISTHFDPVNETYKLEMYADKTVRTPLKQNGDFRSAESIEILQEADIVVTNPPFSLLQDFIAQLFEYGKEFIFIGPLHAVTYKDTFPLIRDNLLWTGYNSLNKFLTPDGTYKSVLAYWYTNLEHNKRNEEIILYKTYNDKDYPKYDNGDAINVDKVKHIPKDYNEMIGVPISFISKWNPKQFEIVGLDTDLTHNHNRGYVNGIKKFARLFIRKLN